jgi:hypothetical protein
MDQGPGAAAAAAAGTEVPRLINVQQFAAAREPEVGLGSKHMPGVPCAFSKSWLLPGCDSLCCPYSS